MAITVADNFSYQGKKPLDGRDGFDTLAQMKAYPEASVYDGCMTYCKEDEKYYTFKASNTVDVTTGKWREFSTGGGGQTYNDFTGATSSTAGAHGLVPAPSAGDEGKVLFGNGTWGALPSVDLSVLSNEAFIFSATEKAVGMAKNGKILYAKTISLNASDVNLDDNNNIGLSGVNIELAYGTVYMADGAITPLPYLNPAGLNNCAGFFFASNLYLGLRFGTSQRNVSTITLYLFYTKTTDSPLPSDVKFAGVTASGEVILEKTITGLSVAVSSDWSTLVSNLSNVKDYISGHFYFGTSGDYSEYLPKSAQIINGTTLRIDGNGSSRTITKATIRYTLAS